MIFTSEQIASLAREHYGLEVTVKPLPGEIDLNFLVKTSSGAAYTLKIANPAERLANLEFKQAMMGYLVAAGLDMHVPEAISTLSWNKISEIVTPVGSAGLLLTHP